jgi:murein L,D-transpeptidase YafK
LKISIIALVALLVLGTGRSRAGDKTPDKLTKEQQALPTLLIAHKSQYRLHLYARGKLVKTYRIALGQKPIGHKRIEGDNRTPEGHYRIIQKAVGPFEGDYGPYLGPRWMRLDYPNDDDVAAGLRRKAITADKAERIRTANRAGKPAPNSELGGGVGIHGWKGEWPGKDRQNLTWGCLSLQNADLVDLYDRIEVGTSIIILP